MKRMRTMTAVMLAGLCTAVAWADEGSTSNRTVITSKRLDFDYKRSIAVFEEEVTVEDPQIHMTADRMNVIFDEDNNVKSVTALGRVRIRQDDKTATCGQAVYIALTGEVIMTGDPKLERGTDTLEGRKITFWTDEDRVTCEPATLIVYPEEEESPFSVAE
ncbi:MAG: hypothetical protein JW951_00130 [Lentisphaerae bacterium]|nr:hypothetical protein [Lentisphaerota bacterium]